MTRAKSLTQHDAHVRALHDFADRWMAARTVAEGECRVFQGAPNGKRVYMASILGASVNVRRWWYGIKRGHVPAAHKVVVTCRTPGCMEHLQAMAPAEFNAWLSAEGLLGTPAGRAAATRNARTRAVHSIEVARKVRELGAQGVTLREIQRLTGVHYGCAGRIIRGEAWREALPAASVFSMAALGGLAA